MAGEPKIAEVVSLEVLKEAKDFKRDALDKVFPGRFSLSDTYEVMKAKAEENQRLDAGKSEKPAVKSTTG